MLAVVAAPQARLDAGSVGLALARRWCEAGERVIFVDADPAGSRLAQRLGAATHADYSPAARGLPSLIVAREPLTLRLLADHCYSLDTPRGSLWALFGPHHPAGAALAAGWLAERAGDLMAVDPQRRVIVSASLGPGAESLTALLRAAPVVAALAPMPSSEAAEALWTRCRDLGLMRHDRRRRVVMVEGRSPLGDDEIGTETGMRVAGSLPVVDDVKVLLLQGGLRDRGLVSSLDKITARLLALSNLDAADAAPDQQFATDRLRPAVNGSPPEAGSGLEEIPAVCRRQGV